MDAAVLERLEAEFASSLVCTPCHDGTPAAEVVILRRFCAAGAPMPERRGGREYLVCAEHARMLRVTMIGASERGWRGCTGCGEDVTRQTWWHIVQRIEPIALQR